MISIRIRRPVDAELAKLWDEAKQAVEDRDCCVGDVSRCRCVKRGGWSTESAAPVDESGGDE